MAAAASDTRSPPGLLPNLKKVMLFLTLGAALGCQQSDLPVGRIAGPGAGGSGVGGTPNGAMAGSTVGAAGAPDPGSGGSGASEPGSGGTPDPGPLSLELTELATSIDCGSVRLALTATHVYWTESASGRVMRVPLAGGAASEVATGQTAPGDITVDAGGVYWVNYGDTEPNSSRIMKKALPLTADEPLTLKQPLNVNEKILALALRAGKLYYALGHDVHAISTDPAEPLDAVVGTAINYDINPAGDPDGYPAGLAVTNESVCWTTDLRYGVECDDIEPGIAGYSELADSQGSLLLPDIAADGTFVYWVNGDQLERARADTLGEFRVTATDDSTPIAAFAINTSQVYFASESSILKHGVAPTDPEVPASVLAAGQTQVTALALDKVRAYWASGCAIRTIGL